MNLIIMDTPYELNWRKPCEVKHKKPTGKAKTAQMIQLLLDHLPDNTSHDDNEDEWNACWNALSADSRYEIDAIREEATQMVKDLLDEANNDR